MSSDEARGGNGQGDGAELFIAVRRAALPSNIKGLRASPACPAKS